MPFLSGSRAVSSGVQSSSAKSVVKQSMASATSQALVQLLNAPGVSSTTYRKYRDKNVLIKSVQDYIIREQLYV